MTECFFYRHIYFEFSVICYKTITICKVLNTKVDVFYEMAKFIWKLFQTAFFFDAYAVLNSSINYKVLEGKIFGGVSNVILIVVLVATNRFTSIVLYLGIVMLIFIGTIKLNRLLIMILTMSFYELIVLFGLFVVYKFTGIFTNNEMEISWLSIIYGYLTLTFIIYLKIL